MDLRRRHRTPFSGFTKAEIKKMEQLLKDDREQSFDQDFYKKLARVFNRSKGRAGKPILKWAEIQGWFQNRQQCDPSQDASADTPSLPDVPETCVINQEKKNSDARKGENVPDLSQMVFEARSSKDGAWYDVDTFLAHRFLSSGEAEVHVRYIGFGAEEDEWVSVRQAVRERSISLENSECDKVKVGDNVLCFQERQDQARYYDAYVVEIQRRLHDIRGCRCLFMIRYDHDNTEESVRLKRLCFRPSILGFLRKN